MLACNTGAATDHLPGSSAAGTRLRDLGPPGNRQQAAYLAARDPLRRELAALGATDDSDRDRLAGMLFDEMAINDDRATAMKPRPELAGFFALACQGRGQWIKLAEVTGIACAR